MRIGKRLISIMMAFCLVAVMMPFSGVSAAQSDFTYDYYAVGNSGGVITVTSGQSVTATVDDTSIATVSVSGTQITVSGKDGAVGIATVSIDYGAGSPCVVEVPVGYTTFVFDDDELLVYEGSDTKYEVLGTWTSGESAVTGTDQEDGGILYSNEEQCKLQVNIKKAGGTYVFTGNASDMSITVNKAATGEAVILLAGLTMKSSITAPITVKKESESTVEITALAGHTNYLEDADFNNADEYGSDEDGGDGTNEAYAESAVIKCKSYASVTLDGAGTLELVCNTKNALKVGAYGSLTIKDLTLDITSAKNGISSDNTMDIQSGTITVDAEADAIRSDPDAVDADAGCAGTINISGGTISIQAGSDGIQAAQDLYISGGTFDIQTGSGYKDSSFNSDTMSCKGLKASSSSDETADTSDATNTIEITGGTFELNTADDAVHSDAYAVITGGKFNILTGDDGVHADTSLTLGEEDGSNSAVKIVIESCYEGLEAGNVYIFSGTYNVTASDDGINSAGGSDSSSTGMGGQDNFNPGGQWGGPGNQQGNQGNTSSTEYSLNISGGKITVNAGGDGLDSNGALNLTGGTIVSWGAASGSADEPLDCDGTLLINGATVFAAGSSSMMTTTPSGSSQAYVKSSTSISTGKTINVKYNGTTVYNIKAVKNVNYVLYSSPDMTSSQNWTIVADDSDLINQEEEEEETEETEADNESGSGTDESESESETDSSSGTGNTGTGSTDNTGTPETDDSSTSGTGTGDSGTSGTGTGDSSTSGTGTGNSGTTGTGSAGMTDTTSETASAASASTAVSAAESSTAASGSDSAETVFQVGDEVSLGYFNYKVTGNNTVEVLSLTDNGKTLKKIRIFNTVTLGGKSFKVTSIAANAFKGNSKIKSVTIGKNITSIGAKAFYGCKNLKKVTVKTKSLTKVGKAAFKNVSSKLTVKVLKAKKTAYRKLFKKGGVKASQVK